MNVLKSHLRIAIDTLLRGGASHLEIERRTGVDRETIRRLARAAKGVASPTGAVSEPPAEFISRAKAAWARLIRKV